MKTFKDYLNEELDLINHSYNCLHCGKQMDIQRAKYKHNRKNMEDKGLGIILNGDAFCKGCVKKALVKEELIQETDSRN